MLLHRTHDIASALGQRHDLPLSDACNLRLRLVFGIPCGHAILPPRICCRESMVCSSDSVPAAIFRRLNRERQSVNSPFVRIAGGTCPRLSLVPEGQPSSDARNRRSRHHAETEAVRGAEPLLLRRDSAAVAWIKSLAFERCRRTAPNRFAAMTAILASPDTASTVTRGQLIGFSSAATAVMTAVGPCWLVVYRRAAGRI